MEVRLGDLVGECPYCGSTEFVAPDDEGPGGGEVTCAQCGGSASRAVVLELVAERAAYLGALTLSRLRRERARKKPK